MACSTWALSQILDLEIFSVKHSVGVLCVTETWFTSSKSLHFLVFKKLYSGEILMESLVVELLST